MKRKGTVLVSLLIVLCISAGGCSGNTVKEQEQQQKPQQEVLPAENPEATEIPLMTENPEATEIPLMTENSEVAEIPAATEFPEPTEAVTPTPEPTKIPLSEIYKERDMTNIDTSWIDPEKKLVAFTFDDGPTAYYDDLLDILETNGMHATFFVWGKQYNDGYKEDIERLVSLGCELGNHTWSHPYLTKLTADEITDEIEKTRALLESITGIKDYLVRPPYGSANMTVMDTVKVPLINWSVDTADWNNGTYESVYSTLTEKVQDGDVVLMHASYKFTMEAVRDAIPVLAEQGYQIVSVSELCAVRGKRLISGVSPLSSPVKKK